MDNPTITYGKILRNVGQSMVSGGYSGARVASTKSLDLKCGVKDFEAELEKYDLLFHIDEAVREYIWRADVNEHPLAHLPGDMDPEALAFTMDDFSMMLNGALGCVLGEGESLDLEMHIEKLVDAMQKRVAITKRLLDSINRNYLKLRTSP